MKQVTGENVPDAMRYQKPKTMNSVTGHAQKPSWDIQEHVQTADIPKLQIMKNPSGSMMKILITNTVLSVNQIILKQSTPGTTGP